MESRAWGASEKRTNLYVLKPKRPDYALALVSVLMLILAIYAWRFLPIPSLTTFLSF